VPSLTDLSVRSLPPGVHFDIPDGTLSLNFNGHFAPIVKSIQELDLKVDANASSTATSFSLLEQKIDSQQSEIDTLKQQIQALQSEHCELVPGFRTTG
jgi:hypothetical protein